LLAGHPGGPTGGSPAAPPLPVHDGNSTRVLVDNALTPIIHKERGLPQGSLLSPLMFLLMIDPS